MQPENNEKYDFILDPNKNSRSGGPNFGSKNRQIVIGVAFVSVVVLLVVVVFSLVFSGGSGNNDNLITVAAHQTEINRVISLGQKNTTEPLVDQKIGTLQTSLISDQSQLLSLLSKRGVKISKQQAISEKSSKNDAALSSGLAAGNHDKVFLQTVKSLVSKYYTALSKAKNESSSNKEKAVLDTSISNLEAIYPAN